MSHPLLLNEDEAYTALSEVKDQVTQNLVNFAIARVRMRLGAKARHQRKVDLRHLL